MQLILKAYNIPAESQNVLEELFYCFGLISHYVIELFLALFFAASAALDLVLWHSFVRSIIDERKVY